MNGSNLRFRTAAFVSMVLAGCATTPSKGDAIQLVSAPPAGCRFIEEVTGTHRPGQAGMVSGSPRFGNSPRLMAESDLREQAAEKGATHVVLRDTTAGLYEFSADAKGAAYQCPPGTRAQQLN